MYYIFNSAIVEKEGKILQATVLNDTRNSVPNYIQSISYATPFEKPMLNMAFTVPSNILLPDNLFTGTGLFIFSEKMMQLIEAENVPFQKFEVTLIDKKTKYKLGEKYYIFHLLASFTGIDVEASDLDGLNTRSITMTRQCLEQQPLLFRDSHRRHLVFIHSKLKEIFDEHDISGCDYIHYEEYQHLFGSLQPLRKSSSEG